MQTLHLVEALVDSGHHCVTVCYFEYDFQMVQLFEQAGSRVVCLSAYGDRPSGNRETYRFLKAGLKRVVNEYRPKVAMVQYMAPGAMPLIILRRLGIKDIVAMLHTDADIYKSLRLVRFLQRHVARLFTCVSETAERNFFGNSNLIGTQVVTRKRSHCTLPNCLPKDFSFGKPQPTTLNSQFTIGLVARLESIKGVDLAIPAFARVLENMPDCRLLIVGNGSMRKMMQTQQQELHIPDNRIEWAGTVDNRKLSDYYGRMTLVWVPSRSEGFGLAAVEAMGMGCPVVAADVGGLKEIVHDGIDGRLFIPENTDDLAEKTLQLLSDTETLQSMSAQTVANARKYSFDIYRERVNTIIENQTL